MTIRTQGKCTAEFLLSEANGQRSRAAITLAASSAALPPGQLLGFVSASGEFAPYAPGADDGSQTAIAVLYAGAPASAEAQPATAIVLDAEVAAASLTGFDEAARATLFARGIVVR